MGIDKVAASGEHDDVELDRGKAEEDGGADKVAGERKNVEDVLELDPRCVLTDALDRVKLIRNTTGVNDSLNGDDVNDEIRLVTGELELDGCILVEVAFELALIMNIGFDTDSKDQLELAEFGPGTRVNVELTVIGMSDSIPAGLYAVVGSTADEKELSSDLLPKTVCIELGEAAGALHDRNRISIMLRKARD